MSSHPTQHAPPPSDPPSPHTETPPPHRDPAPDSAAPSRTHSIHVATAATSGRSTPRKAVSFSEPEGGAGAYLDEPGGPSGARRGTPAGAAGEDGSPDDEGVDERTEFLWQDGGRALSEVRRDIAAEVAGRTRRGGGARGREEWWRGVVEKYGSVELENKGSVARDHLALERTFLAWLRTSLSFASIGIAITQLFRLNTTISPPLDPNHPALHQLRKVGKPLGATFIGIALLILFIGFHRFFESQFYIIRGKFPASRISVLLVSGVAGALIVSSLIVVLAIGSHELEDVGD